jgi:hypothetical protein
MDESFVASSNHILLLIDPGWGELETIAASSEKESTSSSRKKTAKRGTIQDIQDHMGLGRS